MNIQMRDMVIYLTARGEVNPADVDVITARALTRATTPHERANAIVARAASEAMHGERERARASIAEAREHDREQPLAALLTEILDREVGPEFYRDTLRRMTYADVLR